MSRATLSSTSAEKPSLHGSRYFRTEASKFAIQGLFVLAVFFTVYFTRSLLLPIVAAILLSFLLAPIVRLLEKLRIPAILGSALVLLSLVTVFFFLARSLVGPISLFLDEMPRNFQSLQEKVMEPMAETLTKVKETGRQIEQVAEATESAEAVVVRVQDGNLAELFLGMTPVFVASVASSLVLAFFMLAYRGISLERLIHIIPRLEDKKQAVELCRNLERGVSRYLLTIFVINALLGSLIFGIMSAIGFSNPIFWGVLAFTLNFVPYLGSLVGVALMALSGFLQYDSLVSAFLPALVYLSLTGVEGNLITPVILGRRFTINPVVIIIALLFWSWMWGIPGALLAVPTVVVFKVFCSHVAPFSALGELIGRRESASRRAMG